MRGGVEKGKEREEKSPPPSVMHARVRESKGEKFSSRQKFSITRERQGERETGRGNSSRDRNYFRCEKGRSLVERERGEEERERLATGMRER